MLHGRDRERLVLTDLLDRARAGTAGALVIRGDAGVGKSALVDAATSDATAAGMRVLTSQGMESESPLAFAGLHQLLRPLLGLLDELPVPQSRALRIAFGEQEGDTVDRFVIALATLSLLTRAAEAKAVMCVIDDAHWLDTATAEALLFVVRRLQADPVAMIFTARDGDGHEFSADGVPSLNLSGLDDAAGRALLDEQFGATLADEVATALLGQTGGNPLALVELPTVLTREELGGSAPIPAQLHLTERVQRVFLDRCRRLPEQVQQLLLVAATDDTGNLSVVQQAAARLGVAADALEAAEAAELLVTDRESIRVRHPLVRSAIYQAATGRDRRHAHRALAAVLETHPDRQAWHLAAAVEGPDPAVAEALERTAERAERAAGYAAASSAYERAAELTTDESQQASWLFAAAGNAWGSGQPDRGRRLADAARGKTADPILRADIDRLRARIEINVGSAATAHHIFTTAARAVESDDPVRALEMRVAATLTSLYNAEVSAPEDIQASVAQLPTDARTRCLQDLLAAAAADEAQLWGDAIAPLAEAVNATAELDDADVIANVGNAALHIGDDEGHRRCFTHMLAAARHGEAVMSVLYALPRLAFGDFVAGHWDRVRDAADETLTLATATGQRPLAAPGLGWQLMLAALRGDDASYEVLRPRLADAQRQHLGVFTDPVHDFLRWSAGIRLMQAGEPSNALDQLSRLRVQPLVRMAALDRFDAAVRADDPEQAARWVEELADFAAMSRWEWANGAVAYGRALLAAPADAPTLFETALSHYGDARRPFDRARAHLAYGELLRRSQRRVDARPHLRAALAVFEELGAAPLATRAAQELRASGETARKRDPSTLTALTPMELQVVKLVGEGRSNKEVAAQLFISPRTVAFHLRGAFGKLGISSRGELARLDLPTPRPEPAESIHR